MEAQGPATRRGNTLPPEGQASFDPVRNFQGNAASGFGGAGASEATRPQAIAPNIAAAQRTMQLGVSPRGTLLKELISMIGIEGAARLIAAFGGLRVYVPHAPEPDDALSETVGYDAALTLAKGFGGDRIDIPNPPPRGTQILEMRASGVSIDDIARSQRCTRRRVYQVLAEARRKQHHREVQPPQ